MRYASVEPVFSREVITLTEKLEVAILSVLVHYHGVVEASLQTWYLSLKLAFPSVEDEKQIKSYFQQLWFSGLISLHSPWVGDFTIHSTEVDLDCLTLDHFIVTLTTQGVVRWDYIRRYPTHTETKAFAARTADANASKPPSSESCQELRALSRTVTEAGLSVELTKTALDAAEARGVQNLLGRQLALSHARGLRRDAVEALDEHVTAHGCIKSSVVNRAVGK